MTAYRRAIGDHDLEYQYISFPPSIELCTRGFIIGVSYMWVDGPVTAHYLHV